MEQCVVCRLEEISSRQGKHGKESESVGYASRLSHKNACIRMEVVSQNKIQLHIVKAEVGRPEGERKQSPLLIG